MDPVTHALLGAAVGQVIAQKKLGNKAILVGVPASMAPDLDVIIRQSNDPTVFMFWHRSFTHALSFIPIGGALIALLCLLCFKSLRNQWRWVFLVAVAAYGTHGLLDACTSYGTQLLWPFSNVRIAWDIISIVDPIFTLILLMGVVFSYTTQSRKPALIALILCLSYLGFGYYQHQRAQAVQYKLAQSRNQIIERSRVVPELATLFTFRSLYINQNKIYLDLIKMPLLQAAYAKPGISVPLFTINNLPGKIKNNKTLISDFYIFDWFTDGYISLVNNKPLLLADMRYVFDLNPLVVMWGIEFPSDDKRQHVYWRRMV